MKLSKLDCCSSHSN